MLVQVADRFGVNCVLIQIQAVELVPAFYVLKCTLIDAGAMKLNSLEVLHRCDSRDPVVCHLPIGQAASISPSSWQLDQKLAGSGWLAATANSATRS